MSKISVPTQASFPTSADAVVIGGGIVGVATAFWLSRAGLDTVLVEMRDGLSTLTTPNSVESFRAQFTEPAMAELAIPSIRQLEDFPEVVGIADIDIDVIHQGYLFVTDDAGATAQLEAAVATHHELGVRDSQFLIGDEITRRFPYVAHTVVAGTFRQRDGWFSSHEATQGFAKGSSARFLLHTRVKDILTDGKGVAGVLTDRGEISTRTIVNAAGPFAGVVGNMVGLELPLEPVRRQKVFVTPKQQIPGDAPMCIDLRREVYWRPSEGGALLGWVDPDEPVSAPSQDVPTDWDFPAIVLDKLSNLFPFWDDVARDLSSSHLRTSAGYYVYTPDDQPLIGPVPQVPGFYLNCGYWAGVMLAPEAGRRIADLVTGTMVPEDNPLRPTRYAEGVATEGDSFLRGRRT
jgi:glycine/D-amino acid oxidase-like deaminating enzyme